MGKPTIYIGEIKGSNHAFFPPYNAIIIQFHCYQKFPNKVRKSPESCKITGVFFFSMLPNLNVQW